MPSKGVNLLTLLPCQFQRSLKMVCRKGLDHFVDACLVAGILLSGIYLARNNWETWSAGVDDDGGDAIFTGAPPLTQNNANRDCPMSFRNVFEIVVDLSFSREASVQPIEGEVIGDKLLDMFVQVR